MAARVQALAYQQRQSISEQQLADAYRLRETRRIRKDSTLSVDGKTFEVDALWLAGKKVTLERCYLAPEQTCVFFEGKRYSLFPVDPERNAGRQRKRPPDKQPTVSTTPQPLNPADVALAHMLNCPQPTQENI